MRIAAAYTLSLSLSPLYIAKTGSDQGGWCLTDDSGANPDHGPYTGITGMWRVVRILRDRRWLGAGLRSPSACIVFVRLFSVFEIVQ